MDKSNRVTLNANMINETLYVPTYGEELIPLETAGMELTVPSDDEFNALSSGGNFLPRLQLCTSNCDLCKDGTVPVNKYAVISDGDPLILGDSVDVIVVNWRPKALDMSDNENIIAVHDSKDPMFADISARSFEKESHCMFGPEFLVYLPDAQIFATFFMGSKTSRREAPQVKKKMRQAATLKSTLIETKAYKWQAVKVTNCSTPVAPPDAEALVEAVKQFQNPVSNTAEPAGDEETSGRTQ